MNLNLEDNRKAANCGECGIASTEHQRDSQFEINKDTCSFMRPIFADRQKYLSTYSEATFSQYVLY